MPSRAQSVDTSITGVVSDSSGAVIPGATVTITSASTGESKSAVTSHAGDFSVTYLIPGTYQIGVTANVFGTYTQTGIVLQLNQTATINVAMKVASNQQVVQVEETPPMLQTQDTSIGAVVGNQSAENLPLNGRKFDDLAVLTPGVTMTDPDDHTSTTAGSSINSFGSNVVWSSMNVDGIIMVNQRHAEVNLYPSVDAVQEFKVMTGNEEAEYGGVPGSITNIQLKSGANRFNGDVFEFFRNPVLDARNFFRNAPLSKQVLKQNQYGATLGGPIYKDRTFFFGSYEGLRSIEQTAGLTNVLTSAEINGDFSAILPGTQLVSPCTGLPYTNNQIPTGNTIANSSTTCHDGLSTVAQNIARNYMPLPNTNTNGDNYADIVQGYETVNQYIGRIDHKFNDSNQFNIHFIYANRHVPGIKADPVLHYEQQFRHHERGSAEVRAYFLSGDGQRASFWNRDRNSS